MFGWRCLMGYIAPSTLERQAQEWYKIVPKGCGFIATTLRIAALDKENIDKSLGLIDEAVGHLVNTGAENIYLGGIPPFRWGGQSLVTEVMERIREKTQLPVSTDLLALIDAITALKIKSFALISPFEDHLDQFIKDYFEQQDIRVSIINGVSLTRQIDYAKLPLTTPYELARKNYSLIKAVDAIFIACGRFGSVDIIEPMEADFGKPVLMCNQLQIWWGLRSLQINEPIKGYGILLEQGF